jgi:hypothetical protein
VNVTSIENISRRESPVQYRRVYTADAVLSHVGSPAERLSIEFTVEDTADRGKAISVRFIDTPDYPLVPAAAAVRRHLNTLVTQGELV